ncbi:urease accessory protein UreE [Methylopila sp. 73B]|uniref:urease accessory protein UreE n=1 Tax=Methylopila sp. 73B TaxID=1120792 RepID=UPI00035FA75D|nr:urease accessory protein UreE [Methylopila sp. 73B]
MSTTAGIVTTILGRLGELPRAIVVDPLDLTSEERASAHFSAVTEGGRKLRVSLRRGTELQDGDVLLREGDLAVAVRAAPEDLLWLRPAGNVLEWWAACYQLGNLHRPARFLRDGVLTPRDPMVRQILAGMDVQIEEVTQPFVGRRFGAAGAHHHHPHDDHRHHHDHGHSHANGHDHSHG